MASEPIAHGGADVAIARAIRPWFVLIAVCAALSLNPTFRHTFWTKDYLPNVVQQSARNIVLAVGMTFVILTGGIDLSVGSALALSGVALAASMRGTLPTWLAWVAASPIAVIVGRVVWKRSGASSRAVPAAVIAFAVAQIVGGLLATRLLAPGVKMEAAIFVAIAVGLACGLLNGIVVSVGRVPAFVATLGMMSAARGLTLYATDGQSVPAAVPRFMALGQGAPLVVITGAVLLAGGVILNRTRAGRLTLAIGGNEQASLLSGVDVATFKTLAYALSGIAAAFGAILVTAKFGLADTNAGSGAELDAIAAVVIGGTSLSGGRGSITGGLVGALTITVIEAGLVLIGVQDSLRQVVLGALIVATVLFDNIRRRRS